MSNVKKEKGNHGLGFVHNPGFGSVVVRLGDMRVSRRGSDGKNDVYVQMCLYIESLWSVRMSAGGYRLSIGLLGVYVERGEVIL